MIILDSMGHLYSDVSVEELYNFAVKRLRLKSEWNHYGRDFPHFDLTTRTKIELAIKLGAFYVDVKEDFERYDRVKKMYSKWLEENKHLEFWYKDTGLLGQTILRIDFKKLGIK